MGDFMPYATITRTNGENFRQFADINMDGLTDVITQESGAVARFYVNTGSTFQIAGTLQLPPFGNVVAAKDFDNDGWVDLLSNSITGQTCQSNQIRIFWNTGNAGAHFNASLSTNLPLPTNPYCMQSQDIDFNGDGLMDVIATSMPFSPTTSSPGRTYLNNGNRTFTVAADFLWPRDLYSTHTRDFNGDGNADFLVTVKDGWADGLRGMYYYRGNGNGTFQSPIINFNIPPLAAGGFPIQADPFINSTEDVMMGLNGLSPSTLKLGRWNGIDNFAFTDVSIPSGFSVGQGFDLDADGTKDLVLYSLPGQQSMTFLHGNGDATYAAMSDTIFQTDVFTLHSLFTDASSNLQYLTGYNDAALYVYRRATSELQVNAQTATICENSAYQFGENSISQAGVYSRTIAYNELGCDSIVEVLNLTVIPTPVYAMEASITEGQTYEFNGQLLTQTGSYESVFMTAIGCDSIVMLNLTVEPLAGQLDCFISSSGETICLNESGELQVQYSGGTAVNSENISVENPLFSGDAQWTYIAGSPTIDVYSWSYGKPGVLVFGDSTQQYGSVSAVIHRYGGVSAGVSAGVAMGVKRNTFGDNSPFNGPGCLYLQFNEGSLQLMTGIGNTPSGYFPGWTGVASATIPAGIMEGYNTLRLEITPDRQAYGYLNDELLITYTVPADYDLTGRFGLVAANRGFGYSEIQASYQSGSILWSTGETSPLITVSPAETTTYSVTVTQGNQSCTSDVTITVNQPSSTSIEASISEGESYAFNGQLLTAAGSYEATLTNVAGCDSVVNLNLTVLSAQTPCGTGDFEFDWLNVLQEDGNSNDQLNGFLSGCSVYINNSRNQNIPISINNSGEVSVVGVSNCDAYIATLNTVDGEVLFEDIYASPFGDLGCGILIDEESVFSTSLIANQGNSEIARVVFRRNSITGEELFSSDFNDNLRNASVILRRATADRFYLYGNAYNNARNATTHTLLCFDTLGNRLWTNVAPDYDYFYGYTGAMDVDAQGNAYVISKRQGSGGPAGYNVVIRKFSLEGVQLWRYEYNYGEDYATDIKLDDSGNVYLSVGVRPNQSRLVKLNGDTGALLWEVQFHNQESYVSLALNGEYCALVHQESLKLMRASDGELLWSVPMGSHTADNIFFLGNSIVVSTQQGIRMYDLMGDLLQTIVLPNEGQYLYRSALASDDTRDLYVVGQRISGNPNKIFVAKFSRSLSGQTTVLNESICEGDTYSFGDMQLSESGSYSDTLVNAAGCDSIVILNLDILPATTYYADADGDGYGNYEVPLTSCDGISEGYVLNSDDCNDGDSAIYVGASCNDGDDCTVGDQYTSECICVGTFADEDDDGICDAIENCSPVFINAPGDTIYQCIEDVPSFENLTASDCCGGNVVVQFDEATWLYDTLACDQITTPIGPGMDWGMWINGLYPEGASTDWYRWTGAPNLVFSSAGQARLIGRVVALNDADSGWDVDVTLEEGQDWLTWSSEGGLYMDNLGMNSTTHTSWSFYKLVATFSHLEGFGNFEGDQIALSHQPSNYSYGFQFGNGANNRNSNKGGSGWFFYTGNVNGVNVSGHGDLTLDMGCSEAFVVDQICSYPIERRWAATDNCGNLSFYTQNIQVIDTTAPTFINCPLNVEVTCEGDIPNPIAASELIAADNCTEEVLVVYNGSDTTYESNCSYVITHHYSATDVCLNRSNCSYAIRVSDEIAPELIVPADYTIQCGDALDMAVATATDNCSEFVDIVESIDTIFNDCSLSIVRNFSAIDACGNTTVASQTIQVIDTEAPMFVNLNGPYWVECDAIYNEQWVRPAATDNCDVDLTYSYTDEMTSGGCLGTIHRTITVTDNCGNATTRVFLIYTQDTTPPVFTSIPDNATMECGEVPALPGIESILAIDNCGDAAALYGSYSEGSNANVLIEMEEQIIPGDCSGSYTLLWIWTATDYCGNSSADTTTISVVDTTAPVTLNIPSNQTIECSQFNGGISINAPTFTDNCGNITLTTDVTEQIVGCDHVYIYTWTATDGCGNATSVSSIVNVYDQSNPVFTSVPDGGFYSCDGGIDFGAAEAIDACGVAAISFNDNVLAGNCPQSYTIVRTWTATDDCGNTANATSVYNVIDGVAPVFTSFPVDTTLECDLFELPASFADASDNCDDDVSIIYFDELIDENNCGKTIERTFIASDDCGNSTTGVQTIYVNDTTAPVVIADATITISCNEFDESAIYISAIDNCGVAAISIMYDEPLGEGCAFSVIRHYMAIDECNNSSYFNQTIMVMDVEAPVASADPADTTVHCGSVWSPASIVFEDNCDANVDVDTLLEQDGNACEMIYHYMWIARDDCGNMTVVDQFVTVVDNLSPTFDAENLEITVECGTDVNLPNPNATDNCSGELTVVSNEAVVPGNCSGNYTVLTTYTATDACGNSSNVIMTIHYQDLTSPDWSSDNVADFTYECEDFAEVIEPLAMDECSSVGYIYTDGDFVSNGCGGSFVRSWIAVDACGNSSLPFNQIIHFEDTTDPVIIGCPDDVNVGCDAEVPAVAEVTANDNCSDEVEIIFEETCIGCPAVGSSAFNLHTPVRPSENPCIYPYDWAMALFSLPSSYRWYQLDTNMSAQMVYNADGSVNVSGRVFNVVHPTGGFDFNVTYASGKNWSQWNSDDVPSSFKADCGGEDDNFEEWMYYILQSGASFELTGWGSHAGSLLNLAHAPSNQYFGFQIGDGANNYNGDYGAGGWFNYNGVVVYNNQQVANAATSGIGDFAFRIDNCPEYSIVRTWTAIDCAGNSSSCSQTLMFSSTVTDFAGFMTPDNSMNPNQEVHLSIIGIQPNPASSHSLISFTATTNNHLTLDILDVTGRAVAVLFSAATESDKIYTADLNTDLLSSGIYMVRLRSGTDFEIQRLQVQK